jgi:hypothetical protein
MKGYAEAEVFTTKDLGLLRHATHLVELMPGKTAGEWIRCHELARALGVMLGNLLVIDGHYGAIEHSWLITPGKKILDVYVPGRMPQVQLVDPYALISTTYRSAQVPRTDIRKDVVQELLVARGFRVRVSS